MSFKNRTPRAWSTGSTRSSRARSGRCPRTPAAAGARRRLEPGRHLRAAHRRRPARPADRVADRRRHAVDVKDCPGAARRAAAAAAQPHRRARRAITRAYRRSAAPRSRWSTGPSSSRRCRSWSPSRWRSLTHLDDTDFLAQIEAVDRFTANMTAYPGRTFGQLYHRFVKGNALVGRHLRTRRPDHRAVRDHRAGAGLRRRHRRHRAGDRGPAVVPPADRSPARCASRSCPAATSACSPAGPPRHHLAGPRRVGRAVVGGRGAAPARRRRRAKKDEPRAEQAAEEGRGPRRRPPRRRREEGDPARRPTPAKKAAPRQTTARPRTRSRRPKRAAAGDHRSSRSRGWRRYGSGRLPLRSALTEWPA